MWHLDHQLDPLLFTPWHQRHALGIEGLGELLPCVHLTLPTDSAGSCLGVIATCRNPALLRPTILM